MIAKFLILTILLTGSLHVYAGESLDEQNCNISFTLFNDSTGLSGVDKDLASTLFQAGYMPFEVTELSKAEILKNSNLYTSQAADGFGSWYSGYWCTATLRIKEILPSGVVVTIWEKSQFDDSSLNNNTHEACDRAFNQLLKEVPKCSTRSK
jgi:hypothetical protein